MPVERRRRSGTEVASNESAVAASTATCGSTVYSRSCRLRLCKTLPRQRKFRGRPLQQAPRTEMSVTESAASRFLVDPAHSLRLRYRRGSIVSCVRLADRFTPRWAMTSALWAWTHVACGHHGLSQFSMPSTARVGTTQRGTQTPTRTSLTSWIYGASLWCSCSPMQNRTREVIWKSVSAQQERRPRCRCERAMRSGSHRSIWFTA